MYKADLIDYLDQFDDSDDIKLSDIEFLFDDTDPSDVLANQINEYI